MATEFTLPELGENIETGDVVRVLVSPGDTIAKDQPVVELETDKATIEVPSAVSGTVAEVRVKEGDTVKVGQVILTVDGAEVAQAAGAPKIREVREPGEKAEAGPEPKAQPEGAPEEGGLSQRARKRERPAARRREEPAEPEARDEQEADVTAGAEQGAGAEGDEGPDDETEEDEAAETRRGRRGEVVDIRGARPAPVPPAAPAAPSVRRLARELGVDVNEVSGSGPGGRISMDDVKAHAKRLIAAGGRGRAAGEAPAAAPLPDFSRWGEVDVRPLKGIRLRTAERLGAAWAAIPHVTQHDRADVTELEALRSRYAPRAEQAGGKLTVTAIALRIAAAALRAFPHVNTSIDLVRQEIVYKKYVHIGVAVDTPRGLLVPVIRDADRKGIIDLAVELAELSEKARAGKLTREEMEGGTFTITNLGGIGGTSFTPIVNAPEVAILGISRASLEPVVRDGEFAARLMLPLSLSYDHRMVDGADAARFLRWVAEAFEQPFLLSLHG